MYYVIYYVYMHIKYKLTVTFNTFVHTILTCLVIHMFKMKYKATKKCACNVHKETKIHHTNYMLTFSCFREGKQFTLCNLKV